MGEDLLTTRAAADLLGLSPSRVRQFVRDGRLPAQKLGRDLVIARGDLERFASAPRSRTGRPPKKS